MVIFLTAFIVILALGLTLLVIGLRGGRPAVSDAPGGSTDPAADPNLTYSPLPRRRVRLVPLVLGALLTLIGGAAVGWVYMQGLDSDRLDEVVLQWRPASGLVSNLDHDEFRERYKAAAELDRRYKADELPEDVERRLVARHVADLLNDRDDPNAPAPGAPIVKVDFLRARKAGMLSDEAWGTVVAQTAPFRLNIPRRVAPGEPMTAGVILSLRDHQAPAWVIAQVVDFTIDGKPMPAPPAVAIAPNPDWKEPPPQTELGAPGSVTPTRRIVRYEHVIPADAMATLGTGAKEVKGTIRIYAFDPTVTAPPEGLADAATFMSGGGNRQGEDESPESLSLQLTPEQVQEFIPKALGTKEYKLDQRVQIGDAPAEPTTRPGGEGGDAPAGGD